MNLLSQITTFENLLQSFSLCARGKRHSKGYQDFFFKPPQCLEKLKIIQGQLASDTYRWGGYREFVVHDPKKRVVSSASFQDRIVHHAIVGVLSPYLDKNLGDYVYACRTGKGNRYAVLKLQQTLHSFGQQRYVFKLDVRKYFQNICHKILLDLICQELPDNSLQNLLESLLRSHQVYHLQQRGIPIGNLTSQLFANFYLYPLDCFIVSMISELNGQYIRYMDDLVVILSAKEHAHFIINEAVSYAQQILKLHIPEQKIIHLSNRPVPFLGFILDGNEYDILARNKRRSIKKIKRLRKNSTTLPSQLEHSFQSLKSWMNLAIQNKNNKGIEVERPPLFRGRRASGWQLEQWFERWRVHAQSEQFHDQHEHQHRVPMFLADLGKGELKEMV